MTNFLILSTTTSHREAAQKIANALVESRLAACVQIAGPVTSVYRWQGKVEQAQEWTLSVKTSQSHFEEVIAKIARLHDYDCPEIIATPIVAGSEAYLQWLGEQLGPQT
ncbi:divalent-cation tolerance protein CutA [Adhaeretor mobilis]|uniref:Divalent-cation tolerance protein CutA n=1 Tax=Adhaeretor mobilis TaxID=1930276 RepID=A0A517MRU3_9BACT|nr:divalent-cation tolerance protein CutA [Adhaeretor mobilis]QDS97601.1 Divalent-cation tolerance protein CutA [Adhaeretor mobilis]